MTLVREYEFESSEALFGPVLGRRRITGQPPLGARLPAEPATSGMTDRQDALSRPTQTYGSRMVEPIR